MAKTKLSFEETVAQAGLDKIQLEKVKLSVETEKLALEAEDLRRQLRWQDAAPGQNVLEYYFTGEIMASSVWECMKTLGAWTRRQPDAPIKILLSTPGGNIIHGFTLIDYLSEVRRAGHSVEIVALGYAASMGAVVLQSADHRVLGKNGYLLIHEASMWVSGSMGKIEDDVKFTRRLQDRILGVLAERSTLTVAQIRRKWSRTDWWIDAEEALEYGFVDEIR